MDWGSFGLGIIGGMLIKIGGEIISPTLAELGTKLHAWVWKKPYIRGQIKKDLSILEVIKYALMRINTIPEFPDDTNTAQLKDILLNINQYVRKVKNKQFKDIKDKLVSYSEKVSQLHANLSSLRALNLLGRDNTSRLIEEINDVTAKAKKGKNKK